MPEHGRSSAWVTWPHGRLSLSMHWEAILAPKGARSSSFPHLVGCVSEGRKSTIDWSCELPSSVPDLRHWNKINDKFFEHFHSATNSDFKYDASGGEILRIRPVSTDKTILTLEGFVVGRIIKQITPDYKPSIAAASELKESLLLCERELLQQFKGQDGRHTELQSNFQDVLFKDPETRETFKTLYNALVHDKPHHLGLKPESMRKIFNYFGLLLSGIVRTTTF